MHQILRSPWQLIVSFLVGLLVTLTVIPSEAGGTMPQVNWIEGGKTIAMGDNLANLKLPVGYAFANGEDTTKLLTHLGNTPSKQDIGLVVPNTPGKQWFVIYRYDPMGYVKDEESQSIDKDAILAEIRTATEADNNQKKAQGNSSTIEVLGWEEAPHYDPVSHNLVWAISATEDGKPLINYNTRKLGRGGVTSINLVTNPTDLPSLKPAMEILVAAYEYAPGNKYSDFVAGKDKVAEIGLIALIAGGASVAAKTGAFAKLFLFLAVIFKKAWIFIAIGIGALFKKQSGNKKSPTTTEVESKVKED